MLVFNLLCIVVDPIDHSIDMINSPLDFSSYEEWLPIDIKTLLIFLLR